MTESRHILSASAAAFVASGGRDLEVREATSVPGGTVRLIDERGNELGLGLSDPENHLVRVLCTTADRFARIDAALLGWRVERALALRRELGLLGDGDVFRLVHGAGDGVPGYACDVLGRIGILYAYAHALVPLGRTLAEAIRGFAGLDSVVIKVRARGEAAHVAQEIVGPVPPERLVAHERGVPYEIHPLGGLNVGIFTDMREHRVRLARLASGRRVLNLFSYTGSLSLACARGGAATVTSVDTSSGVHAWAGVNFRLSGLDDAHRWRFEVGDAVRFLSRAARERERYDLVVIDPPTYSTARGKAWAVERDYPDLIARAAAVVPDGGLLWLAANSHELASLTRLAARGITAAKRGAALLEEGGLPPDHPTVLAQPRDRYLKTCLLRLGA